MLLGSWACSFFLIFLGRRCSFDSDTRHGWWLGVGGIHFTPYWAMCVACGGMGASVCVRVATWSHYKLPVPSIDGVLVYWVLWSLVGCFGCLTVGINKPNVAVICNTQHARLQCSYCGPHHFVLRYQCYEPNTPASRSVCFKLLMFHTSGGKGAHAWACLKMEAAWVNTQGVCLLRLLALALSRAPGQLSAVNPV